MGTADIVPGVSGGTVALVLGIYNELIHNISQGAHGLKQLLTGDVDGFRETLRTIEWIWLFSLLLGVLAAVFALSSVLERLLDDEPVKMSALFLGLVAGAIWVALRMLDKIDGASTRSCSGSALPSSSCSGSAPTPMPLTTLPRSSPERGGCSSSPVPSRSAR